MLCSFVIHGIQVNQVMRNIKHNKSLELGPTFGGRRRIHGMGQKVFIMLKMSRSCHGGLMYIPFVFIPLLQVE
jgi:hypothetical protein